MRLNIFIMHIHTCLVIARVSPLWCPPVYVLAVQQVAT